jgi:cobalt/nickel transport system permease protein
MHLPDHYLDPATCIATGVLAGATITYAVKVARKQPRSLIALAGTSTAIFAAQMINFPVAGDTSGHLLGGALAAMLLGPAYGLLAITTVLAVQAVVFGDGGILALGANILNMGVIAVGAGALVHRAATNGLAAKLILAAMAAWISVVLAALACGIELAIAGMAEVSDLLPAMIAVHARIGLAEAAITCTVVLAVWLFQRHSMPQSAQRVSMLVLLVAVLALLTPLSSALPDGLSSVADPIAPSQAPYVPSLFTDYTVPGLASAGGTILAAVLGVMVVCGVLTTLSWSCLRMRQ